MYSRLGVGFRVLLLAGHLPPHNILSNIILLPKVEEFPNLSGPLRPKTFRQYFIRQPSDLLITFLHNHHTQHGDIRTDNAASNGLALALACTTGAVTRVSVGEEELDTVWEEDTLFHWESLFVISTRDTEDVSFPFVADRVSGDFLGDFLFVEDTTVMISG